MFLYQTGSLLRCGVRLLDLAMLIRSDICEAERLLEKNHRLYFIPLVIILGRISCAWGPDQNIEGATNIQGLPGAEVQERIEQNEVRAFPVDFLTTDITLNKSGLFTLSLIGDVVYHIKKGIIEFYTLCAIYVGNYSIQEFIAENRAVFYRRS